jgi:hypothetical protein
MTYMHVMKNKDNDRNSYSAVSATEPIALGGAGLARLILLPATPADATMPCRGTRASFAYALTGRLPAEEIFSGRPPGRLSGPAGDAALGGCSWPSPPLSFLVLPTTPRPAPRVWMGEVRKSDLGSFPDSSAPTRGAAAPADGR